MIFLNFYFYSLFFLGGLIPKQSKTNQSESEIMLEYIYKEKKFILRIFGNITDISKNFLELI